METPDFVIMGFRLKTNGVYWYFKDLVQAKYGNPNMWYRTLF
jgi:hypothetical protein